MSDDEYLWEKRGPAEASTRELESVLGAARFGGMRFPAAKARRWPMVLGAGLVAAAAALVFFLVTAGNRVTLDEAGVVRTVAIGEWLEPTEPVTLSLARKIGVVEVAANARVRVQRVDDVQQRLELARGSVHAIVNAPPKLFVVKTPVGAAVDLGCEYTLTVLDSGATHLHVLSGKVELEGDGQTVTVYEGMWSRQGVDRRAQVAVDDRASLGFLSAVLRVEGEPSVLPFLLSQAAPRDAITLLQLGDRFPNLRPSLEARVDELVPREGSETALDAALRVRR